MKPNIRQVKEAISKMLNEKENCGFSDCECPDGTEYRCKVLNNTEPNCDCCSPQNCIAAKDLLGGGKVAGSGSGKGIKLSKIRGKVKKSDKSKRNKLREVKEAIAKILKEKTQPLNEWLSCACANGSCNCTCDDGRNSMTSGCMGNNNPGSCAYFCRPNANIAPDSGNNHIKGGGRNTTVVKPKRNKLREVKKR